MNWMEIAVTVSSEGEEAVTDLFYRLGSQGVVVEAPELIKEYIDAGRWDYHEFDEIEITGRLIVKGYLAEDERLDARLVSLREELLLFRELFPDWVIESEVVMVKEEDWANEWKRYFKPVRIGRNFLIKPTWEDVLCPEGVHVIEIDPGMAFGTGTHPTTTLCLKAIEDYVKEGHQVFDIGTGSGILAVAAAKLGADVQAGDIDTMAVRIAKENADLNGVAEKVQVQAGNLGEVFTGKADIVIANIIADVIVDLLPELYTIMKPNGVFLACGIIEKRADDVLQKIEETGLDTIETREEDGWILISSKWALS